MSLTKCNYCGYGAHVCHVPDEDQISSPVRTGVVDQLMSLGHYAAAAVIAVPFLPDMEDITGWMKENEWKIISEGPAGNRWRFELAEIGVPHGKDPQETWGVVWRLCRVHDIPFSVLVSEIGKAHDRRVMNEPV